MILATEPLPPRWTETLAELVRWRRLIPVGLLAGALALGQVWFTPELGAFLVALILVVVFLALGPHAWRRLFGAGRVAAPLVARGVLFVGLGLTAVAIFGWALPRAIGYGHTFLSAPGSLLVEPALFWVGAWGLGRDIELELRATRLELRAEQLTRQAEEAQLMALRDHLDPHFLFNTLNALAEWCRIDPVLAERGILGLATLLRGIFEAVKKPRWTLGEELALVHELFELHRLRDPSAFTVTTPLTPTLSLIALELPALVLLPLAENAMTHGIARGHRGAVSVSVSEADDGVHIAFENPGTLAAAKAGTGHGLAATRKRMEHVFGRVELALTQVTDERVRAELVFPKERA